MLTFKHLGVFQVSFPRLLHSLPRGEGTRPVPPESSGTHRDIDWLRARSGLGTGARAPDDHAFFSCRWWVQLVRSCSRFRYPRCSVVPVPLVLCLCASNTFKLFPPTCTFRNHVLMKKGPLCQHELALLFSSSPSLHGPLGEPCLLTRTAWQSRIYIYSVSPEQQFQVLLLAAV